MTPGQPAPTLDADASAAAAVAAASDTDPPLHGGQLRLLLHRAHPGAPWQAELAVPGASGRLAFPSLEALAHWLRRQDRAPPGLR